MEQEQMATMVSEQTSDDELTVSQVKHFLSSHPQFFHEHHDLLEVLAIPHTQKGTVSLLELQNEQLRDKLAKQKEELTDLIVLAKRNEHIYRVLTDLNVRLLDCTTLASLTHLLAATMKQHLGIASVALHPLIGPYALTELQQRSILEKRFIKSDFFFGRLSAHERKTLYGEQAADSSALMLIGEQERIAILAIGSDNPNHFTPNLGTLLLKQLQQVLCRVLPPLFR